MVFYYEKLKNIYYLIIINFIMSIVEIICMYMSTI